MSTEVYRLSILDRINKVDPIKRGDPPMFTVGPGELSRNLIVRINEAGGKEWLLLKCDEDNSETRIYEINPEAKITSYGKPGSRGLLIAEFLDENKITFELKSTIFSEKHIDYQIEDEVGNIGWIRLVHRFDR